MNELRKFETIKGNLEKRKNATKKATELFIEALVVIKNELKELEGTLPDLILKPYPYKRGYFQLGIIEGGFYCHFFDNNLREGDWYSLKYQGYDFFNVVNADEDFKISPFVAVKVLKQVLEWINNLKTGEEEVRQIEEALKILKGEA